MRFVIADDMDAPRLYAKARLQEAGHEIVADVKNGRDAVAACAEHRPDVAFLDISMPVMNGTDAAGLILDAGTARHVVFGSSQSQQAVIAPYLARGAHFIGKPYDKAQLIAFMAGLSDGT